MGTGTALAELLKTALALGFVILVVKLTARVIQRRGASRGAKAGARGRRGEQVRLQVLQRHALSKGASLVVVDAGARRLLLGVSQAGVHLVGELDAEDGDHLDGEAPLDPGGERIASLSAARETRGTARMSTGLERLREMTVRRA